MDVLRTDARIRFTAIFEWIVAGLFLCATVAVCSLIFSALFTPVRPVGVSLAPPAQVRPFGVPPDATSMSELALPEQRLLTLGSSLSSTAGLLGRGAETGRQDADPGRFGDRLTRFYERDGTRFVLVFEPFERGGEPRLAAIYLVR